MASYLFMNIDIILSLAFTPDSKALLSSSKDETIKLHATDGILLLRIDLGLKMSIFNTLYLMFIVNQQVCLERG